MTRKLIITTLTASFGGLLFGFETAVINGALPFITQFFSLTDAMKGATVSAALVGCIVGALAVGRPADRFGRRTLLRVLALLFLISAIGTGFAANIQAFIIFRFIGGIAVGGASVISPMYISEISPAEYRGRLTVSFQLAVVVGILFAFFTDYLLINTGENNWRYMMLSMGLPAIVFYVLLFFIDRSPRWLIKEGKREEAIEVFKHLNPEADSEKLVEEIQKTIDKKAVQKFSVLFKKDYSKLLIIGIAVGMFNQFTGINIIMYYATDIFRSAGFSTDSAIGQTVLIGLVNLIFTILAMRLIDKIGRRKLLLTGTLGMAFFLGLFAYAYLSDAFSSWMLLVSLICFIAFFASSQGAVIWVILSEIFPNNIRARGASAGSFSHWFFNGLTTFLFPVVIGLFSGSKGVGYVFIFYSIMTFLSFFVFKKYLMEMKGKTLESMK
ncbi:sugar porter family MFS transporter [Sunxiuqinia elliptica]|uniref:MFS transporter, sugar porter (SP) family n=1 Tax=Sunxiuqinia elliptica TaxID=655355 RepID=A0A1I2G1C6_9BACT|nr:sugar porter family MFS transporter [Sunxiuqinia elliptica]SFF10817.1 MFS transporter, sugar porter (SP) family [Sunxiuqinia elliptica]